LPRFLDDKDLYCNFVRQVAEEESFPLLGEAIAKADAKAAFEKAHELKGVLANMSLTPLFNTVVEIVEPLRGGRELQETPRRVGLFPEFDLRIKAWPKKRRSSSSSKIRRSTAIS
jgi:hypothetical protein